MTDSFDQSSADTVTFGLIPAWAGKTTGQTWRNLQSTAHPRVGGENGGRPASRTRRMFNNVTVGGRAVVGVIDRSDPREA